MKVLMHGLSQQKNPPPCGKDGGYTDGKRRLFYSFQYRNSFKLSTGQVRIGSHHPSSKAIQEVPASPDWWA